MQLSGIFIRDYLLDAEREHASDYRVRLSQYRQDNMATLLQLRTLVTNEEERERIDNLQVKLDDYWEVFEPLFDWTAVEKSTQSFRFSPRFALLSGERRVTTWLVSAPASSSSPASEAACSTLSA